MEKSLILNVNRRILYIVLKYIYLMNQSIRSMGDLFQRLNYQGINLKISNLMIAISKRNSLIFQEIIIKRKNN